MKEWKIKITNRNDCHILVQYEPIDNVLVFKGQFKPSGKPWVDIHVFESNPDIGLDVIRDILFTVYTHTNEKIKYFDDFDNTFNYIKEIEINVNDDE